MLPRTDPKAIPPHRAYSGCEQEGRHARRQTEKLPRDRLSRVQGQIGAVMKMIEEDRYCVDILNQTSATMSAIRNVENIDLENHLNTCVGDAMKNT